MKRGFVCRLAVGLIFLLTACASEAAPPPPPEEIVRRAVETMTGVQGFSFSIDRSGGPAYLDASGAISFRRADGVFVAPDRARANVRVIVPGLVAEIRIIAIGERYWETDLLSGAWAEVPAGQAFNPATLFDAAHGLQPILESGLRNLSYDGLDELDEVPGVELHLVSGDLETAGLYDLSFSLIGPAQAGVQLWIHPDTYETYRIRITEPSAESGQEASVWQVDFWNFGVVEDISPPE